jgi:toxin YhaV
VSDDDLERYRGWLLLAHPHFEDQWSTWSNEVRRLAAKKPDTYRAHEKTKRLANLVKLVFDVIPRNPAHHLWLQGNTLGPENRAWRRAKFGQQYRLFFRFDSPSHIIIYGWINDEKTLRARGSKTDAYTIFQKMLESGSPPSRWEDLLNESGPLL